MLKGSEIQALFEGVAAHAGYRLTIDLAAQQVTTPEGTAYHFDIDPFRKDCLYRGLDAIGLTLQQAPQIAQYEQRRRSQAPWLFQDVK